MESEYDIVIIGGGLRAMACAYEIAKLRGGAGIAVLMAANEPAPTADIIRSDVINAEQGALYAENFALWKDFAKTFGQKIEWDACGVLDLCHDEAEFDFHARVGNEMMARGEHAVLMNRDMVYHQVPNLNFANAKHWIYGGNWQKDAGTIRADLAHRAMTRAAQKLGVAVMMDCAFEEIVVANGKIMGVKTVGGVINCAHVVMAMENGAIALAQKLGVELPIQAIEMQTIISEPIKPILNCVVQYRRGDLVVRQRKDGAIVAFGLRATNLEQSVMEIFPKLSDIQILEHHVETLEIGTAKKQLAIETSVQGLLYGGGWMDMRENLSLILAKQIVKLGFAS